MNLVDEIIEPIDRVLKPIFSNKVGAAVVTLVIVLYAGLAAPKLPKSIAKLFSNSLFKLVILTFVAYSASKNASIAILSAVALVVSMQTLSKYERSEIVIQELEQEEESSEEPSTEESNVEDQESEVPSEQVRSETPVQQQEQYTGPQPVGVQPVEEERYAAYNASESGPQQQVQQAQPITESEEDLNTSEEDRMIRAHAEQEIAEESEEEPSSEEESPEEEEEQEQESETATPNTAGLEKSGKQVENNEGYPKRTISIENCQKISVNEHLESVTGFDMDDKYASY